MGSFSSFYERYSTRADIMPETNPNQNESGDSQRPEEVRKANPKETEAVEAAKEVQEDNKDLKAEFPFAEPTVVKDDNSDEAKKSNPTPSTSSDTKSTGKIRLVSDPDGNITQIKFPGATFTDNDPLQKCIFITKSGKQ